MSIDLLGEHYIKEIKTLKVSSRYVRTIGSNARIKYHGNGPDSQVRAIITDKGAIGWGISWTPEEKMTNLVGRSVAELFDPSIGVIAEEAMPLDFPLHDLAGVILDQPVYKMIGGKGNTAIPCYDGAIYMDDLVPEENPRGVDAVIESCKNDYEIGFRDFKVKIGRGFKWMELTKGFQRDVDVIRNIRKNFPECRILVDANDGYTCDDMIRFMDAVSDYNIFWIEEPFRENREYLKELKEFLAIKSPSTLIADGEGGWDIDFLLQMGYETLIDVLQMDIAGYGFTAWRKLMPTLIDYKVLTSPHTWGDPLKVYYTAHLAAGLGNVLMIEGIPAKTFGVDTKAYKFNNGILYVPEDKPGFGMQLKI